MAGGKIDKLGRWRSVFMEFFFKPAVFSAAIFAYAWMRWASPPKSFRNLAILKASDNSVKRVWGNSPILRWKMGVFAYVMAAFCEADNAYETFFYTFGEEYQKIIKKGGFHD